MWTYAGKTNLHFTFSEGVYYEYWSDYENIIFIDIKQGVRNNMINQRESLMMKIIIKWAIKMIYLVIVAI